MGPAKAMAERFPTDLAKNESDGGGPSSSLADVLVASASPWNFT